MTLGVMSKNSLYYQKKSNLEYWTFLTFRSQIFPVVYLAFLLISIAFSSP